MANITHISIETILYAAAGGILPTFLWLWFWIQEDGEHAKPLGIIILTFISGAIGLLLLLPLKPIILGLELSPRVVTIIYAFLEEFLKYSIVSLVVFRGDMITRSTDYTIFLVTGALGFSALENTLYLIEPIAKNIDIGTILITGNMRFLGATVLHSVSVALVGVLMGLAHSFSRFWRTSYAWIGLFIATGLHTVFNYFIIQDTRQSTINAIAGVWIVAVIVILIYDRLGALEANLKESYQHHH